MGLNWIIITIVFLAVIIFVFFLIMKNSKDEKDYQEFLNENDIPIDQEEDEANNY